VSFSFAELFVVQNMSDSGSDLIDKRVKVISPPDRFNDIKDQCGTIKKAYGCDMFAGRIFVRRRCIAILTDWDSCHG